MKISEVFDEWDKDSKIDWSNLGHESVRIPELHNKYYKVFLKESLRFKKMESDLKTLRFEKWEFYIQGPTKETQSKGWIFPSIGKILKNEVEMYINVDKEVVEATLQLAQQQEKVDLLESIIKNISNRTFYIKNAIDFLRFTNGQ